jgi:hypothetical protein
MMHTYATIDPTFSTVEEARPPVRWNGTTLQQLWLVKMYRDGQPWKRHEEWRDVPTVPR